MPIFQIISLKSDSDVYGGSQISQVNAVALKKAFDPSRDFSLFLVFSFVFSLSI